MKKSVIWLLIALVLISGCRRNSENETNQNEEKANIEHSQEKSRSEDESLNQEDILSQGELVVPEEIKTVSLEVGDEPYILTEELVLASLVYDRTGAIVVSNNFAQFYNGEPLRRNPREVRLSIENQVDKVILYGADMERLAFWMHGSQESCSLPDIDTEVEYIEEYIVFLAGIGQGPRTFDIMYKLDFGGEWKTFVSRFMVEDDVSRLSEKLVFQRMSTVELEGENLQVFKESNSIWVEHIKEGRRYLTCLTLDYEYVMDIDISDKVEGEEQMVNDVFFREKDGQLMVHLTEFGGVESRFISIPYENNGSARHIVGCGDYYFVNGRPVADKLHENDHMLDFANIEGTTYLESNNHLVLKAFHDEPFKYYEIVDGKLAIFDESHHQIMAKDLYGNTLDEVIEYTERVYGDHTRELEDGRGTAYISDKSLDLIIVTDPNMTEQRIELPTDVKRMFLNNEWHSEYRWELIEGGIAFLIDPIYDGELYTFVMNRLFVYLIDQNEIVEVTPNVQGYMSFAEGDVVINNHYTYVLDTKDMTFRTRYENMVRYQKSFRYNNAYYDYVYIEENVDLDVNLAVSNWYKLYSEAPFMTTKEGDMSIYDVAGDEANQCVQLNNGVIGFVVEGEFSAISDMDVRTFDSNDYGVVYSGYLDEAKGYFYDKRQETTYVLETDSVVDEIKMINDKIVVLTDGHIISRYDVDTLKSTGDWDTEMIFDLRRLDKEAFSSVYTMDANNQGIIIYTNNYLWGSNSFHYAYIFDQDLILRQELQGEFSLLMEDYLILRMGNYKVSTHLKSGEQKLITDESWVFPTGGFEQQLILRDTWLREGYIWAYDLESEGIEVEHPEGVNQIVVHDDYQFDIIMNDYENQTFALLKSSMMVEKIWIEGNMLYVDDGYDVWSYELPNVNFVVAW